MSDAELEMDHESTLYYSTSYILTYTTAKVRCETTMTLYHSLRFTIVDVAIIDFQTYQHEALNIKFV